MSRYNDEDFDGLVIKLPSFFISQNKLGLAVKKFHDAVLKAKFSTLMIGVQSSLNEMEEWETKAKTIRDRKADQKEIDDAARNRRVEKFNRIRNKEIYPLSWEQVNLVLDDGRDNITMNGKLYEFSKYSSRRGVFNKEFKKIVMEYFSSPNFDLNKCIKDQGWELCIGGYVSDSFYKVDLTSGCPIYSNAYLGWSIHFKALYVRLITPGSTWNDWRFHLAMLENKNGKFSIMVKDHDVSNYIIDWDRMELVKG